MQSGRVVTAFSDSLSLAARPVQPLDDNTFSAILSSGIAITAPLSHTILAWWELTSNSLGERLRRTSFTALRREMSPLISVPLSLEALFAEVQLSNSDMLMHMLLQQLETWMILHLISSCDIMLPGSALLVRPSGTRHLLCDLNWNWSCSNGSLSWSISSRCLHPTARSTLSLMRSVAMGSLRLLDGFADGCPEYSCSRAVKAQIWLTSLQSPPPSLSLTFRATQSNTSLGALLSLSKTATLSPLSIPDASRNSLRRMLLSCATQCPLTEP